MDDQTHNMVCDTQIKEEFLEDFSEIKNHEIQIDQKDNSFSNNMPCENNCQTICPIKVEIKQEKSDESIHQNTNLVVIKEENLDDIEYQNYETDPLSVENSNIDDTKFHKIPSAFHETHCVSKEPNQKLVKFTFSGQIATVERPSTNSATLTFTKSSLNPNEFVGSVANNKTNYLIPNKSLQYILPKSVQQKRIPITRNPPNSKLVDVSGKPRKEKHIEWECPSHLRKDLIYLNEKLRKLGKIQIMEIAKHIKDITKDKKAKLYSSKKEWLVQYVSKIATISNESFLIFKQAYNIVRNIYNR